MFLPANPQVMITTGRGSSLLSKMSDSTCLMLVTTGEDGIFAIAFLMFFASKAS
jgi:hypothetical protein